MTLIGCCSTDVVPGVALAVASMVSWAAAVVLAWSVRDGLTTGSPQPVAVAIARIARIGTETPTRRMSTLRGL